MDELQKCFKRCVTENANKIHKVSIVKTLMLWCIIDIDMIGLGMNAIKRTGRGLRFSLELKICLAM